MSTTLGASNVWTKDRWVYIWADGVYSGLRAEQAKLCALVVMGVNERGEKHFSGDRGRCSGIDSELARGFTEAEVTRPESSEAGDR